MSKIRDTDLNPSVFAKMYNLRLLKVYNSNKLTTKCKLHFPKGLKSLPDALRYLHWYGYPLKCLPSDFSPENLVVLEMPHSQVEKLWDQEQVQVLIAYPVCLRLVAKLEDQSSCPFVCCFAVP